MSLIQIDRYIRDSADLMQETLGITKDYADECDGQDTELNQLLERMRLVIISWENILGDKLKQDLLDEYREEVRSSDCI